MFSSEQIKKILVPTEIFGRKDHGNIQNVAIDSRHILEAQATLFICLIGLRNDGHDFISELYDAGVRAFVITKGNIVFDECPEATFYRVPDGIEALQALARAHRKEVSAQVVGITGSNGKTIVKEWLASLMGSRFKVYKSPASYNSQIGVALSVLGIDSEHEWAFIEAGISRPGEMEKLEAMIQPDFGILTNIGDAHDSGFESREEKVAEKLLLFTNVKWWLSSYAGATYDDRRILWSSAGARDNSIRVNWHDDVISFEDIAVKSRFNDAASLQNMTHCLVFMQSIDKELLKDIQQVVDGLDRVSMRTEVRKGLRGCTVISDYYNADIESLSNVLQLASQMVGQEEKVLVLSQLEDVNFDATTQDQIRRLVQQAQISSVYLIGPSWHQSIADQIPDWKHFPSTEAFLKSGSIHSFKNQLIILKGARAFQFERIERRIVRPVYGTRLEIDQEALHHNWLSITRRLPDSVKKMVMVKASAYGSGLKEIARFYQEHKVDFLGVAYANEGVELREEGVTMPIMVMNAEPWSLEILEEYDLQPEIHGINQLKRFLELADHDRPFNVHLKCETGMNRLGFNEDELAECLALIDRSATPVTVVSVFTHLGAVDDPEMDELSRAQLHKFDRMYEFISSGLGSKPLKHALNSAGTLRFPEFHFDMVRLGIALYGYGIPEPYKDQFLPVHNLKSYIIQVKDRAVGETIGYGGKTTTVRPSRIATIPVGYADGIARELGHGNLKIAVKGHWAPTIGRICMDMCMIDVTDFEDVREGDEVEIFGRTRSLDEFAALSRTIPYEVLVRIGPRVERVFTKA